MAKRAPGSGFSIDKVRTPLVALGILGILAGLGALLVEGQFGLTPRILIAAGVLLLGVYVALDPEDVWGKMTGRGARYSGNTLVIAAAALVILGLFNVLGSRYQTKVDLTANQQFTLSDQSARVVESLSQPVKITGWLSSGDSRRQDFQTLLSDYAARSNGKISFELIDPELRPGEAVASGITEIGTVVYEMGGKKQNSTGTTEKDVSSALVKLERPEKKVYFTTGHGERSLDGFEQGDYSQIKQALERDNFTTAPLNLITQRAIPDDAAAVIVAGPTGAFLPEEKDVLRAYLDGGGKLLLMLGPGTEADFNDLLQKYQVSVNTNQLVVDPAQPFLNDVRVPVVDRYGSHAITEDLRLATFYPAVSSITIPQNASGDATVVALASSSNQSWGNTNQQTVQRAEGDPNGPLPIAVAIEANPTAGAQTSGDGTDGGARIVVIGTPNLVANRFLSVSSGNQELFLDSANWLAEQDNLINVRAPETVSRTMLLTGPQMNMLKFSSFLFLPLAVLAFGAAVWWARR